MIRGFSEPIYVTRPFLPSLKDFSAGLGEIWENAWLTNNGPVLQRFERELETGEQTANLCLFNNGTLALQIALQGMELSGEIITTPFTFVATSHALFWNKIRPVFVDITPDNFTLDPARVEAAITPWTTAILAVHVYGYPCDLEGLQKVADRHKLKLLYDAAHAFGVAVDGRPISHFGDLSMFSFHATKLFHSIEGGMLVFRDPELKKSFNYLKNFGFENEVEVMIPGTNAKMNEIQALMGLQVLHHLNEIIERRAAIDRCYRENLASVPGLRIPNVPSARVKYNHAYFPILIDGKEFGMDRDALYEALKTYNIFSRRYFYPLLTDYTCYKRVSHSDPLQVARQISSKVLTLPIYDSLPLGDVERICEIIAALQQRSSPR